MQKTFEELGITDAPYIEEYKIKYGRYPKMQVKSPTLLPTRFRASDGALKYQMKTTYRASARFRVEGLEAGKRAESAVNVVLSLPGDPPETKIILTPENMNKKMAVCMEDSPAIEEWVAPEDPEVVKKNKEAMEKIKKEALIWF